MDSEGKLIIFPQSSFSVAGLSSPYLPVASFFPHPLFSLGPACLYALHNMFASLLLARHPLCFINSKNKRPKGAGWKVSERLGKALSFLYTCVLKHISQVLETLYKYSY